MHGVRPGGGDVHDAGRWNSSGILETRGWAIGIVPFWELCRTCCSGRRMKRCLRIRELGWMLCCASSSVVACLAIFPLFTTRTTVILIADGIIFANGYLANGNYRRSCIQKLLG